MPRSTFGRWGARLDRDGFARALAALGIVGADEQDLRVIASAAGPVPWHLSELPPPPDADPEALSKAWTALLEDAPRPLRLAVGAWPSELRTPAWLLQELARPAVGLDGVFLEAPPRQRPRWSWPLQIAILDGGRSALRR